MPTGDMWGPGAPDRTHSQHYWQQQRVPEPWDFWREYGHYLLYTLLTNVIVLLLVFVAVLVSVAAHGG